MFQMFEGNLADQGTDIERQIMFPFPIETKHMILNLEEYHTEVDLKVNILGSLASESYTLNPILDERMVTYGKLQFMVRYNVTQ